MRFEYKVPLDDGQKGQWGASDSWVRVEAHFWEMRLEQAR